MSSQDLPTDLGTLHDYFASVPEVVFVCLFGSLAREQAYAGSDIDIAVMLDKDIPVTDYLDLRLKMIGDVMRRLNRNDVDLLILNEIPLALGYRVFRDGKLIFCRDTGTFIETKARTISLYLDFKLVIERHKRAILSRARKGALLDGFNPYRGAVERYRHRRDRLKGDSTGSV